MAYLCGDCLMRGIAKDGHIHHVRALNVMAPHVDCEHCYNEALFVLDDEKARCDTHKQLHLL